MKRFSSTDPVMAGLAKKELDRQSNTLSLIPSENHTSRAVLEALASVATDKYAEGYPGKRYYAGNEVVDQIENLTRERAQKLFNVPFANVQAYSGSPANFAVYLATCKPGDTIMGLDLPSGGHLTHGWKASATSQFWNSVPYHMADNGTEDFEGIGKLAKKHRPKIIWCGGTALPRVTDYKRFAKIADSVGAFLVADISHVAGLIAGEQHPSPVDHAHIITTTTHKTLRGPRGAMIMVTEKGLKKDRELSDKIDRAVFPGLQGGPHMNTIAAIGVALKEASVPSFKRYAKAVTENAKTLATELKKHGFKLVSDGTDNHLILVDLSSSGPGRGIFFHLALERIGLITNKNTVPNDPSSPFYPSGLRLGTPAATTRGMGKKEMIQIAEWIKQVSDHIGGAQLPTEKNTRLSTIEKFKKNLKQPFYSKLEKQVREMCKKFPIPAQD